MRHNFKASFSSYLNVVVNPYGTELDGLKAVVLKL